MKLNFAVLSQPAQKARGQVGTTGTPINMRVCVSPLADSGMGTAGDKLASMAPKAEAASALPAICPQVSPACPHTVDDEKSNAGAASPVSPVVPIEIGWDASALVRSAKHVDVPVGADVSTCADCANFTRRKTCTEPVAAGLLTEAQGFGILWPDVEHAAQCVAFNAKLPKGAKSTRFKQSNEGDESGNAIRMDDDESLIFVARADHFTGMGRADAETLAEKLTRRDREHDDRRLCLECTWLGDSGRCLAAATGRISGADRRLEPVQTILRQCGAFGLRKGLT